MPDVLRNFFRAPTLEQKAADLNEVLNGRELLVACRLPVPPGKGIRLVPQGHLHVHKDRTVWIGRGHPEMTFQRGEWLVRTTPDPPAGSQWGIVSLLKKSDSQVHQELRVPMPDMDLIRSILSDDGFAT